MTIKFGTDGWRGVIADDFTFDNVKLCSLGLSSYLKEVGLDKKGLVIGYDTRFLSREFGLAVAEVVSSNGIKVFLCDKPTPTPVVSYSIKSYEAGGAVIITASHNPYQWNGFKYKPEYAGSASPEIISSLEQHIKQSEGYVHKYQKKTHVVSNTELVQVIDAKRAYIEHVAKLIDVDAIKAAGFKVVADVMYGAGIGYISEIIAGGRTDISEVHDYINPTFPDISQPEPIAHNLGYLSNHIKGNGYDVGLALDGDADRFGLVDDKGDFITSLQVLALLTWYMLEIKGKTGAIVKSITSTSMIYKIAELYNVPVFETPVGFKYIGPKMMTENALIGGEESGGFGFRGHITERDGILAALFILEMMEKTGRKPSELIKDLEDLIGPHAYNRVDISFSDDYRPVLEKRFLDMNPDTLGSSRISYIDDIDGKRFMLDDGSWLVIRFSGTEPLLRIYSESYSSTRVDSLIADARNILGV